MSDPILKSDLAKVSQVPLTCMGLHVRRASRILTHAYNDALRPVGLVSNQFTLLVAINLLGATTISTLAQELFTDQTTLTRNLKLLKEKGMIDIEPGEDRRVRIVSLTDLGLETLAQALPLWEQVQIDLANRFELQKWQTLLSLLSDITTLDR
jgi:DNA-binding MarR family transcriptional regulator